MIGTPKHRWSRKRMVVALLFAWVMAIGLARVSGYVTDGPLISCQVCYDSYPDWWCVYVWGCPWPAGGGGDSGGR